MSTSTVGTLIEGLVSDVLSILYGVLPELLTGVAILIGIFLGVRYAWKWIRKFAK